MPTRRLVVLVITALVAGFPQVAGIHARQATPRGGVAGSAETAAAALDAVRGRFAPDRRLVVFDVATEQQGDQWLVRGQVESAAARDAAIAALRDAGFDKVVDQIAVLPDPALGPEQLGIVRVSVANVRSKPAHAAEMATQSVMGWTVRVLRRQSGWYLVHTEPDGYLGWIEELQLTRVTADALRAWDASRRVIVTASFGNVLEGPEPAALPVTDVVAGALLKSPGAAAGWTGVELPDGRKGFIRSDDVQEWTAWKASTVLAGDAIERTASRFMGVPYLWGGTSTKGFDCSGFAKTVFRLHGLELPRDTDQQAREGIAVPTDDEFARLAKGDLLFFGPEPGATRITHVGIYVGAREFLHASGLVRRNSLDPASPIYSESLRKRLVCVRRVLSSPAPSPSFPVGPLHVH